MAKKLEPLEKPYLIMWRINPNHNPVGSTWIVWKAYSSKFWRDNDFSLLKDTERIIYKKEDLK